MTGLERFERLAAQARAERGPPIAITQRVLRAISRATPRRDDTWSVALFALAAAVAASVMAGVALDAWNSLSDPLAGFCPMLTLVAQ